MFGLAAAALTGQPPATTRQCLREADDSECYWDWECRRYGAPDPLDGCSDTQWYCRYVRPGYGRCAAYCTDPPPPDTCVPDGQQSARDGSDCCSGNYYSTTQSCGTGEWSYCESPSDCTAQVEQIGYCTICSYGPREGESVCGGVWNCQNNACVVAICPQE